MTFIPKNPNGQTSMANSQPVTIANDQSAVPISSTQIGATNESAAGTDTATSGLNGLIKRLLGKFGAKGQNTKAESVSVTIASDQGNIAVNDSTNGGKLDTIANKIPALGQAAKAGSLPVTLASDQGNVPVTDAGNGTKLDAVAANIGATNEASANETVNSGLQGKIRYLITLFRDLIGDKFETAAASDTEAKGLNGLLKRNNQNITLTNVAIGDKSDAAATTDTGTFPLIALFKRWLSRAPVAIDIDNAALTNTKPNIAGGKAEDTSALPTFSANDTVIARFDKDSGAQIVLQGDLDGRYDVITISEKTADPSLEITRPANTTAYTAGDAINQTTAIDLNFPGVSSGTGDGYDGGGYITKVIASTTDTGLIGKTVSLYLYNGAFFNITNDNSPYNEAWNAVKFRVAKIDIKFSASVGSGDGEFESEDIRIAYKLQGTNFNGQLVAKEAFTPSANSTKIWIKLIVTRS